MERYLYSNQIWSKLPLAYVHLRLSSFGPPLLWWADSSHRAPLSCHGKELGNTQQQQGLLLLFLLFPMRRQEFEKGKTGVIPELLLHSFELSVPTYIHTFAFAQNTEI